MDNFFLGRGICPHVSEKLSLCSSELSAIHVVDKAADQMALANLVLRLLSCQTVACFKRVGHRSLTYL